MAVTKASFRGRAEERQWSQDSEPSGSNLGAYPDPGPGAQALLTGGMVGAAAMNDAASKGLTAAEAGNGGRPGGMAPPLRSTYSVITAADNAPPAGNSASTGAAGATPTTASGMPTSDHTGIGQGSKVVRRYGGSPGAAPPAVYGGQETNLGRNTAR